MIDNIVDYYDKLVKEDCIRDLARLKCRCHQINTARLISNGTYKGHVCNLFQEIADTMDIPFQDVFTLWNTHRLLIVFTNASDETRCDTFDNDMFLKYVDGQSIVMVYNDDETTGLMVCSFTKPEEATTVDSKLTWNDFYSRTDYVMSETTNYAKNRRNQTYNTKVLIKEILDISNSEWKEILNNPCYVTFEDLQDNEVSHLKEIMKAIPDYEIDIYLTVCVIQNKDPYKKDTYTVVGNIIYHLAKVINEGKLRKRIQSTPDNSSK